MHDSQTDPYRTLAQMGSLSIPRRKEPLKVEDDGFPDKSPSEMNPLMPKKIIYYEPKKLVKNALAIIGLPGFVGDLGDGRVAQTFRAMNEKGVHGHGLIYSGAQTISLPNGKTQFIFDFDLKRYIQDLEETIEEAQKLNPGKKGIIASSIGATIAAYYLSKHPDAPISAYFAFAPLVSWDDFGTEEIRRGLLAYEKDFLLEPSPRNALVDITSPMDLRKGFERYIPTECLAELKEMNTLNALRDYYRATKGAPKMRTMVVGGKLDDKVSQTSLRLYHEMLHGKPEDLKMLEGQDHYMSPGLIVPLAVKFFEETLLGEKAA